MKSLKVFMILCAFALTANAQRSTTLINNSWTFHLGDASSMQKDFTHGTEYFTYLAKAASSNHNQGPVSPDFDDSSWKKVSLPYDWVVDLPYSGAASHSHGYKMVGWKYPQNSVGWYRKHIFIPKEDEGKDISVRFDGIFRNSQVFCNGFYLGHEVSGYASDAYNLSEYLNYGADNVITVRADASTEEGWYYEGGGIYRDVWLVKKNPVCSFLDDSLSPKYTISGNALHLQVRFGTTNDVNDYPVNFDLYDAKGEKVASFKSNDEITVEGVHLWSVDYPYLYTLVSQIKADDKVLDEVKTKIGFRDIKYDVNKGVLLNGKPLELKGVDLHLDHAGVGVGVPDSLWSYKIKTLKAMGCNAIRCSHNPATPAMLDICDSLGMLVIDENRLMGTNREHYDLLKKMIDRDRNHPSVMLWSIGNEEWAIESGAKGEKIAKKMVGWVHRLDSSRPATYGNSGGFGIVKDVDIHGYNYIVQNDVENRHHTYPDWFVVGTEETTGCGTRNVYCTDSIRGWMKSINMAGEERSDWEKNVIERGWKWYKKNAFAGGLFYWTGFDYRGEPNPMVWPATGSQFGILDYCGFPKDEAYYLKAAWTDEPVLHIFPHWNLPDSMVDKPIEVWAYSNMDEVELFQDGKSLGRQKMPADGHLVWDTNYKPGKLLAKGYKNGKLVKTEKVETTDKASQLMMEANKKKLRRDGQDIAVINVTLLDKKGRYVPDACDSLTITVDGPAEILGCGNGDPGFKGVERPLSSGAFTFPTFMGNAQIIIRSKEGSGKVVLTVSGKNIKKAIVAFM